MLRFTTLFLSCVLATQILPSTGSLMFSPLDYIHGKVRNFNARDNIKSGNVTQKVDHFNPFDTRTFILPYFINDTYFKENGPIFIHPLGDGEFDIDFGHMYKLGQEFGAYMIAADVRFHFSYPNGQGNTSMANLQFNTFEQKIADFAHLIKTIKSEERFSQSKVVVFGCSEISGHIATWLRLEHADIVDGAVASSVPVNVKAGIPEFFETMSDKIINEEGQDCRDIINAAFQEALQLIARNDSEQFTKIFNLCEQQSFQFEDITSLFAFMLTRVFNFNNACPILYMTPGSPIEKMTEFFKEFPCLKSIDFNDFVKDYKEDGFFSFLRPKMYNQCKETGLIPVSESPEMLFADSIPLSFITEHFCPRIFDSSVFGENMIRSIERVNQKYGGLTPNVTKVIFVHGSLTVNKLLGITEDLNSESPAIVIEGESLECADMKSSWNTDSPQLKAARQRIREIVMKWIQ